MPSLTWMEGDCALSRSPLLGWVPSTHARAGEAPPRHVKKRPGAVPKNPFFLYRLLFIYWNKLTDCLCVAYVLYALF